MNFSNCKLFVHAAFPALTVIPLFTVISAGGGGTEDHAELSNLTWEDSGHDSGLTEVKLAAFDTSGLPVLVDVPTSAIPYFDATIGTTGDYANFSTAAAAGKTNLKVISAFNEAGNVVENNLTIYIPENIIVNMGAYKFNGTNTTIKGGGNDTYRGTITFAYASAVSLVGSRSKLDNIIVNNNSTIDFAGIGDDTLIYNCYLKMSNYQGGISGTYQWTGILHYVTIEGGGAACRNIIKNDSSPSTYYRGIHISLAGTFQTNSDVISDYTGKYEYLSNYSYTYFQLRIFSGINNLWDYTARITLYSGIYSSGRIYKLLVNTVIAARFTDIYFLSAITVGNLASNQFVLCKLTGAVTITGDKSIFTNCVFDSTVTISSDYCIINNCTIVGLLTLSSGAEYNNISNNTFTAGLTNSSGNTTNIIEDNI